jgi:hypothetical protein
MKGNYVKNTRRDPTESARSTTTDNKKPDGTISSARPETPYSPKIYRDKETGKNYGTNERDPVTLSSLFGKPLCTHQSKNTPPLEKLGQLEVTSRDIKL